MKKPEITINLRRFHVNLKSKETGEEVSVFLTLDKATLQAAQTVGQSSKELLGRIADRNGYDLVDVIGKPDKMAVTVPLDELWRRGVGEAKAD